MTDYDELIDDLLNDILAGLEVYLAFGAYCAQRDAVGFSDQPASAS